jgi:hypothetical protein
MAINAPNPGTWLADMSLEVTTLRNVLQSLVNRNNYVAAMGGLTFLEAAIPNGIGLSAADAAVVQSQLGNLAALAGTAAPTIANSEPLWGGL